MKVITITHANGSTQTMTASSRHEVMAIVDRYDDCAIEIRNLSRETMHNGTGVIGFPMKEGILKVMPLGEKHIGTAIMYSWGGEAGAPFPVIMEKRSNGLHLMWGGRLLRIRDQQVCLFNR